MLTDAESKKLKIANKPRSIAAETNKQWSDKQKIEAVQSYLLLGNLAMTARMLGIPEITLRVWKTKEWWKDTVTELKSQEKVEMSNRLRKIVDASLAVVEDRLVNGDYQFDQKSGTVVRKPVAMKDAHKVATDMQDRRELIDKAVSGEKDTSTEGIETKLLALANKFAEFATKSINQKVNEHRTVDAEDVIIKEEE
jgi:transposase-like protein